LGVEGPKGGKIKKKVEGTGQRQSQRMVDDHSLSTFGAEKPRQRGFEARVASLDVGIVRGRLVSSQLSVQLPENSGARVKGNWPSEVSRLQYLAGCSISWHCDMISE
jgi:hypothetical protein